MLHIPLVLLVSVTPALHAGTYPNAAVAASFTLSVVRPDSRGSGGGGFMIVHLSEKHPLGPRNTAINYREMALAQADL